MKKHYETPGPLADFIVREAKLLPGMSVLDAHAGRGALTKAVVAANHSGPIFTCEMNTESAEALKAMGFAPFVRDFFQVNTNNHRFDRVLLSPPSINEKEIDHIYHGYAATKPGGRLVALTYPDWETRQTEKSSQFRGWLFNHHAKVLILDPMWFPAEWTGARLVVINK